MHIDILFCFFFLTSIYYAARVFSNYYTQREVMPILRSYADNETRLAENSGAYMLIKSRDLKRLGMISPERIRITSGVGETFWNLVALVNSPSSICVLGFADS